MTELILTQVPFYVNASEFLFSSFVEPPTSICGGSTVSDFIYYVQGNVLPFARAQKTTMDVVKNNRTVDVVKNDTTKVLLFALTQSDHNDRQNFPLYAIIPKIARLTEIFSLLCICSARDLPPLFSNIMEKQFKVALDGSRTECRLLFPVNTKLTVESKSVVDYAYNFRYLIQSNSLHFV